MGGRDARLVGLPGLRRLMLPLGFQAHPWFPTPRPPGLLMPLWPVGPRNRDRLRARLMLGSGHGFVAVRTSDPLTNVPTSRGQIAGTGSPVAVVQTPATLVLVLLVLILLVPVLLVPVLLATRVRCSVLSTRVLTLRSSICLIYRG